MSGRGNISVNQTPQYGDKTVIQKMANPMTETPMTGNPVPAPTAGRPSEGGQPMAAEGQMPLPASHQEMMQDLARKAWAAQFWAQLAQSPQAGSYVRMYAQMSADRYEQSARKLQSTTPFFE